jgi:hypothetical protein
MKKIIIGLVVAATATLSVQAQLKKDVQVIQRNPQVVVPKKALVAKPFTLADASAASGKTLKPGDMIKTISGKSITVEEYLKRVNKIEEGMAPKGASLRTFKPAASNLVRKPVVLEESRINTLNLEINRNLRPLLNLPANNSKLFMHKGPLAAGKSGAQVLAKNPTVAQRLKDDLIAKTLKPETIEKTYDVDKLLKPLADKINAELDSDDAEFKLVASSLVVRSHVVPPATLGNSTSTDIFAGTESEYKVAVNFGASMKVSVGLPISITIPLATMNGEFIAPANTTKKLSRKVVVNLLGRSLFNRTAVVTGNTLDEEFSEELDIAELVNSPAMGTASFFDGLPSLGFNTDFSTIPKEAATRIRALYVGPI